MDHLLHETTARKALATLALALLATASSAQDVLLTGGKLVDPVSKSIREEPLLIVDGRIQAAPQGAPEGFSGRIVDVKGRWIIPGLVDLHTHSVLNMAPEGVTEFMGTKIFARRMLYAGVTSFLDLFNDEGYIFELRNRQRRDGLGPTADIFAAGPCFTATGGHGTEYPIFPRIIDTPADARREVADLAAKNPDVVKIIYHHEADGFPQRMPSIDKPTLQAAVETAAAHGLTTILHIRSWQDIRDAVEVGADAVTHIPFQEAVPADMVEMLAASPIVLIPTLTIGDLALMDDPEILDSELAKNVTNEAVLAAYRKIPDTEGTDRMRRGWKKAQAVRFENLGKLARAGVRIAAGTDTGNLWTLQGFSLHRELVLMVEEAGLDPWQALAAATTNAGAFLKRHYGLSPGDEGSVVVLNGSPIEDISNTQDIHLVVHHGVVLDREALKAQPDDAWNPPVPSAPGQPLENAPK